MPFGGCIVDRFQPANAVIQASRVGVLATPLVVGAQGA
jgi:hypothetical protein